MYVCTKCWPMSIFIIYDNVEDGKWSSWKKDGACICSSTANVGSKGNQAYKRECNNPPPTNNGLPCDGDKTKTVNGDCICGKYTLILLITQNSTETI